MVYHRACVKADEIWNDGNDQKTKKWGSIRTYGGRFVENVTQAVARDVMAAGLVRIEEEMGLVPIMSVHDEAVYELEKTAAAAGQALALQQRFERPPTWALDLPVSSERKQGLRYGK
jgi:DNA polymerase